jgi:hypothetical protein
MIFILIHHHVDELNKEKVHKPRITFGSYCSFLRFASF